MKKIKIICVFLISIFIFNLNVSAASGYLKVSSSTVNVKSKFKVTVNIVDAAAWNIHVTSSGPVSNCSINEADVTSNAKNTNKTFSINCTATKEGTITIELSGDITSSKNGVPLILSEKKTIKAVAATKKTTTKPQATTKTQTETKPQTTTKKITTTSKVKSDNNKLKEITVDGYILNKINDNNYTLKVSKTVSNINITAYAEESTSIVTGTGNHELNIGDNNIEIIITSESGLKNIINIKVTKKDEYYIEDLEEALNNNITDITIEKDTIIKKEDLDKIKEKNKTINFNYYDENNEKEYTWIVDGSLLEETNDFLSTVTIESKNKKEMMKESKSADGLYIGIEEKNSIPSNIKLKINTKDKFNNNDIIRNYGYNKKYTLIENNLKLDNNYLEFIIKTQKDYLLTTIDILNINEPIEKENTRNILPLLILFGIIIILIIYIILSNKKNKTTNQK